jgi:hypothetical protein
MPRHKEAGSLIAFDICETTSTLPSMLLEKLKKNGENIRTKLLTKDSSLKLIHGISGK